MKCHSLLGIYFFLGSILALGQTDPPASSASESGIPAPKLAEYRTQIEPLFKQACVKCHGPKKQKGRFRIDTLNPDFFEGEDVSWWLEVFDVLSNGEMLLKMLSRKCEKDHEHGILEGHRATSAAQIWMDDTARRDEKTVCQQWTDDYGFNLEYVPMEKGLGILKRI